MTTTTLHLQLERGRFAQLLRENLLSLLRPRAAARSARPADDDCGSAASEARAVREMAFAYTKTDPGYAADLYAAASRHERIHGVE
jgi:hypothetical protein